MLYVIDRKKEGIQLRILPKMLLEIAAKRQKFSQKDNKNIQQIATP